MKENEKISSKKTFNLNDYRENVYQNEGFYECPHYSEDGVILKIFKEIGINDNPLVIEFGEHRSLGTTTRAFRIKYKSRAIYFTGDLGIKSFILNVVDIFKISFKKSLIYLKFLFNLPFRYYVTPKNIIELFKRKKVKEIDILTIDIDSYDYYIAKRLLEENYKPRLLILEYNPSLGYEQSITFPLEHDPKLKPDNKRVYGCSFKAIESLTKDYNYSLVHISGFCNLFYVQNRHAHIFKRPNLKEDAIKNNKDVIFFIDKFCQKGFIPSWLDSPELSKEDLKFFDKLDNL